MAFTKVVGAGIHTLSNIASHNINSSGIITATKFVGPFDGTDGDFSGNVTIDGNLTVNGTTTTLDTNLTEVDKVEVAANNSTVGVAITQSGSGDLLRLYDGTSQVVTVDDEGKVGIGTDNPESGQLQVIGSGYHQINISGNKTANANKTGGISFLNYQGSRTSVFQTFANSSSNTLYYGSADSSARGVTAHKFYVNTDQNATTGHALALNITSDGQVVINRAAGAVRATSASKLEVFNDTYNTIYVSNSTAAINQEAGIMFAPANNTYGGQIVVKSDEDFSTSANRTAHMAFYTRHNGTAAERLRIKSDGKFLVGIHTSSTNYGWSSRARFATETAATDASSIHFGNSTNAGIIMLRRGGSTLWHHHAGKIYTDHRPAIHFETAYATAIGNHSFQHQMTMKHNAGVGIGTVDPARKLHLHENGSGANYLTFTNTTTGVSASNGFTIGIDSSENAIMNQYGNKNIEVLINGSERLRIASDGKVKIGHVDNTNPTEPLHVVATAVNQDIARFTGANKDRGLVISTAVSGITNDSVIKYNAVSKNSVGQHVFLTDDSEKLRITSGGKIGIGTDNPTYKLHVDSGDAAIGLWKSRRSSGSYIEYAVGADGAALGYIGAGGQIISSAGADSGDFAIRSQGDLLFSSGGSVERLRINANGKVGINQTTNIQTRLQVSENIADSTAVNWANSTMSLSSVVGGNSTANRSTLYFAPYNAANQFCPAAISVTAETNYQSTLKFFTNVAGNGTGHLESYERLRIDSSGRVLVGTTDTTTIGTIASSLVVGSTTNNDEVALTLNVMEGANNRRVKFFLDDDDGVFGIDSTASSGVPPFVVRMATSEKLRITSTGEVNVGGDYTQTSRLVNLNGGGRIGQLQLKGTEADLWLHSTGVGGQWRILGSSGNNTHAFRIYDQTNSAERLRIDSDGLIETKTRSAGVRRMILSGSPSNSSFNIEAHDGATGTASGTIQGELGLYYNDGSTLSDTATIKFERGSGAPDGAMTFFTQNNERLRISSSGHVIPGANNTQDLGSTAKGWRNIYTNDLNLSNMNGEINDIDGTQGSWTIQEGKDDLYIINRLNGKKFKIKMEEIS